MNKVGDMGYHDLLWDDDLLPEHIPSFDSDWSEISVFALNYQSKT